LVELPWSLEAEGKTVCDYWEQFKRALLASIISIDHRHFQVGRYKAESAWRERAYCYELYHQLRLQLGDAFPYTLHGEIDKRGHNLITQFFDKDPNPDFVVHIPGGMDNLAVIEVKPTSQANTDKARYDLSKLQTFVESVEYVHGIFLVFGPSGKPNVKIPHERISVLWHREVGQVPEILCSQEEWQL
jgi:hypothetical protein